jgi:hypothetical protein
MDGSSFLRLQGGATFRAIVASIWVFLWIRMLLSVGAVLEFIFMISDPIHEMPTANRSRAVLFTSNTGASLGQVATSSAGTTAAGSPE